MYYNYDEAGNHYDHSRWTVQSNQLQEFRGKQYKYDGFGRLRAIISGGKVEKQFEYDCQNQLIESLNNSSAIIKAKYEYDALGRRIKKLVHKSPKREYSLEGEESKTQLFFWQGLRMVGETTKAHLENRRWYAYNEGSYEPIVFIDYWDIVKRDEVYYYHTNINGAPEELTSESGEFTWQGLFSLFGKLYREKKDGHTLYGQPLRLQGQYFDEETGLHYNTFRYYDPDTGRFTQQDPIGLLGGINLYQYGSNPLMWVDPLGWECTRLKASQYEQKIQSMYGEKLSQADRTYNVTINGNRVTGIADYVVVLNNKHTAIEAKYVANWAESLRNPASSIGKASFAIKEQQTMLSQAQKYSMAFDNVIYHTNSPELAAHYNAIFQNAGLTNIIFKVTQ